MREISDKEVEFIFDDIRSRGVVTKDVGENLLDHICCVLEQEMTPEDDFYKCYESTIVRFYDSDLSEIEDETQKLLTFKYYYAMRRVMKVSSLVALVLILLGVVFKTMHWPGAGILIFSGLTFFSLIFIPLNVVLKFRDDEQKSNRLLIALGMILASTATMGALFKVMHWPFANMLMLSSLLTFMIVFIPVYFIVKYRNPESRFNSIINTTFMVACAGMLFALIDLSGFKEKQTLGTQQKIEVNEIASPPIENHK